MPAVQRMGDANNDGGVIVVIPQSTVFVNGLQVAVVGSNVTAGRDSPPAVTQSQSGIQVFIGGIQVIVTGDRDSNGMTRVGGSGNVSLG